MSASTIDKSNKSIISFHSIISINWGSPFSKPLRPEPLLQRIRRLGALSARACERECSRSHARFGRFVRLGQVDQVRAAQAYMLISMPTGSSTIFGAFQDISDSSWFQCEFYCSSRRR
jgi:hypothetical protein